MKYVHPCGNLDELPTLKNTSLENPLQCIYNDIIHGEYLCPKKECPSNCQKNYHEIKAQIIKIESNIEDLEKLIKQD